MLLCCLLLISPAAAQDDNPPTQETTEITVPTDSVSVTTENDPETVTGWIDGLAPWVIIVVLLVVVWRQGADAANLIPRETVETFLERAGANAKLTETTADDLALEVFKKVVDLLYARGVDVPTTPQSSDLGHG